MFYHDLKDEELLEIYEYGFGELLTSQDYQFIPSFKEVLKDKDYEKPKIKKKQILELIEKNINKNNKSNVKLFHDTYIIIDRKIDTPDFKMFKKSLNNLKLYINFKPFRISHYFGKRVIVYDTDKFIKELSSSMIKEKIIKYKLFSVNYEELGINNREIILSNCDEKHFILRVEKKYIPWEWRWTSSKECVEGCINFIFNDEILGIYPFILGHKDQKPIFDEEFYKNKSDIHINFLDTEISIKYLKKVCISKDMYKKSKESLDMLPGVMIEVF